MRKPCPSIWRGERKVGFEKRLPTKCVVDPEKSVGYSARMADSDSTDLYKLCEKITSEFLPDELSDFRNEGMLKIQHTLQYPKAYSAEKTFGMFGDSGSGIKTDEFSPTDVHLYAGIVGDGLKCIPLIVSAIKAIIDFRNLRMSRNSKQEQVVALKKEWANYLGKFNFPAEAAKEITDHYAEDLATIAAK
jgi:hypothetical protein